MVLTLDNVVCDHSITQRLNWQTVLLGKACFSEEVGLGQGWWVEVLKKLKDMANPSKPGSSEGHREGYRIPFASTGNLIFHL